MPITLNNYTSYQHNLAVGAINIPFFVFNGTEMAAARARIDALSTKLSRLPALHVAAVYPVLLIPGRLSSSGEGGGTPDHPAAAIRGHETELGANPDVVQRIMQDFQADRARQGFHWIPSAVWDNADRFPFTVLHEAIHGIDICHQLNRRGHVTPELASRMHLGSTDRAERAFRISDFPTVMPGTTCHAGPVGTRASVNAYCMMMSDGFALRPEGDRRQVAQSLFLSKAFVRVPSSWWDASYRDLLIARHH